MAEPPERIDPEALHALADAVAELDQMGFTVSMAYIEAAGPEDHYLGNIDAVGDWIEDPQAIQRKLNQIDESTSDHASELMVCCPDAPMITRDPDVGDPVFWEFEAMIKPSGNQRDGDS